MEAWYHGHVLHRDPQAGPGLLAATSDERFPRGNTVEESMNSTTNTNTCVSFGSLVRRSVMIVMLSTLALMPIMNVQASGYDNIGGYATQGSWGYYGSQRYITDPSADGPDVAFFKYNGPPGLQLGTWSCPSGGAGTGPYDQALRSWGTVAPHRSLASGARFCLFTNSTSGNGNFNGDLNWD